MAANEDRSDRTRDTGISHPAEPYDQPARPLRARKPVSASQSPEIKPRKTPLGGMLSEVQRLAPEILVQQTNAFSLPLILLEKWLTRVKSLPIQ